MTTAYAILLVLGVTGVSSSIYMTASGISLVTSAAIKVAVVIAVAGGTWMAYQKFKSMKEEEMRKYEDKDVPKDASITTSVIDDLVRRSLEAAGKTSAEILELSGKYVMEMIRDLQIMGIKVVVDTTPIPEKA